MSSTTQGNGIATPSPTQPGMVKNCDHFHLVQSGQSCASIGVNAQCSGMWANTHVCVRTIGYTSGISLSCGSTAKEWGGNKPSALTAATNWCDGRDNTDGSGGFVTAQTKRGCCFNAALGDNKFEFVARNDFGAFATLSVTRCREFIQAEINGCTKGGAGVSEGWRFR